MHRSVGSWSLGLGLRTFYGVSAICLLSISLSYAVVGLSLLSGYSTLETKYTRVKVAAAENAYLEYFADLNRLVDYWASHIQSSAYLETQLPSYSASNFSEAFFTANRLNFVLVRDRFGHLLLEKGFDLNVEREITPSEFLPKRVLRGATIIRHVYEYGHASGLVQWADQSYLISARPVYGTHDEVRGFFIVGRLLDSRFLNALARSSGLPFVSISKNDTHLPLHLSAPATDTKNPTEIYIRSLANDSAKAYLLLRDLVGRPAVVLATGLRKDLRNSVAKTLTNLFAALIAIGLVACIAILWLMRRWILSRIKELALQTENIVTQGDLTERILLSGRDELADVASSFNRVLEQLEASQHALRSNEAWYQQMFEKNRAAKLLIVPETGGILDANAAACDLYGYDRDEMRSKTLGDISLDLRQSILAEMLGAETDPRGYLKDRHQLANGDIREVEVHASPLNDRGRRLLLCLVHDVTTRVDAEKRLRLAARVFESTPVGLMITDSELRIATVNPAFTDTTGYSLEEAVGKAPNLLNSGRHDLAFFENMWASLAETGQWQGEIWNRRKDGDIYLEWLSINVIKNEGAEITHYVGIFSDISAFKPV